MLGAIVGVAASGPVGAVGGLVRGLANSRVGQVHTHPVGAVEG